MLSKWCGFVFLWSQHQNWHTSFVDQLNGICSSQKGDQCVQDLNVFSGWYTSFAYFPCIFFSFLVGRKKKTARKKYLPFPLLQLVGFSTRLLYSVTTKLPFLLCHAVGKLLASRFSLSRTSALLVLLPLGSFQHGHVIPQLEAPVYFLMHFSAVQCSHSQREHHCMYLYFRIWNVKKAPELAVLSIIGPPKQQLIQQWEVPRLVFSFQHPLIC